MNEHTPTLDNEEKENLRSRLETVLRRMWLCLEKNGRSKDSAQLVAISKYQPAEAVAVVAQHWQALGGNPIFGENYMQEAMQKIDAVNDMLHGLPGHALPEWHFTGHLQSRKAKNIAGYFTLIHTLDSTTLASNLQKSVASQQKNDETPARQPVLIQINIGEEPQKSGVMPADLKALAQELKQFPLVKLEGLMCLPPNLGDAEGSRPYFKKLRQMRDELQESLGLELPHLSMGMSYDFEAALDEGATLIRVGTDIFGPRKYDSAA